MSSYATYNERLRGKISMDQQPASELNPSHIHFPAGNLVVHVFARLRNSHRTTSEVPRWYTSFLS